MKAKLVLEAKPKNVSLARDWAYETCRNFGIHGRRMIDVKTITSEIVTNVVRHAYHNRRKKNFVLKAKLASHKLTLTVRDFGAGFDAHRGYSLHVGLTIVNSLAGKVKIRSFGFGTHVKVVIFLRETEVDKVSSITADLLRQVIPH